MGHGHSFQISKLCPSVNLDRQKDPCLSPTTLSSLFHFWIKI